MLSVLTHTSFSTPKAAEPSLTEAPSLQDAVRPFASLVIGKELSAVHLHCTVPTWCHSSSNCLDLHDLHELRSRFLVFIHDLLQSIRSNGIHASYSLIPSDSSCCVVCAVPPEIDAAHAKNIVTDLVHQSDLKRLRKHILIAELEQTPCLIIS